MDAFLGFLFLCLVVFCVMLFYKKRRYVARWLEDPSMAASASPDAKRRTLRRRIEDAEAELAELEEIESNKK